MLRIMKILEISISGGILSHSSSSARASVPLIMPKILSDLKKLKFRHSPDIRHSVSGHFLFSLLRIYNGDLSSASNVVGTVPP